MSVVVTLCDGDSRLVPIGNAGTVVELMETVREALALAHPVEAYDVLLGEETLGGRMDSALEDVGIHGAEEKLVLRMGHVYVVRERLRETRGIVTAEDAKVGLVAAVEEDAMEVVAAIAASGLTPLLPCIAAAVKQGRARVAEVILDSAPAGALKKRDILKLLLAACKARLPSMVERLSDLGLPAHAASKALCTACEIGARDVAAVLVSKGANVNAVGRMLTPLHEACDNEHVELAEYLLDNGADINARAWQGDTPLMLACNNAMQREVAMMLVRRGADVNIESTARRGAKTPLHEACARGDLELVTMLLQRGADPARVDGNGWTPLARGFESGFGGVNSPLVPIFREHSDIDVDAFLAAHIGAE